MRLAIRIRSPSPGYHRHAWALQYRGDKCGDHGAAQQNGPAQTILASDPKQPIYIYTCLFIDTYE